MENDHYRRNEAETRAEYIDEMLKQAGWGVVQGSRVRREYPVTLGRLEGGGRRGTALKADYLLVYHNIPLAVIEAKKIDLSVSEGVAQAKEYANKLNVRFAYSTNGQTIYAIDMQEGHEGKVAHFPSPEQLWQQRFAQPNRWRERFGAIDTPDQGRHWELRYYQELAINRVLEAIADGKDRVLLTLATGTGKTAIAFQICWKLFQARWNLQDWHHSTEPSRRPRILFLADRNTLVDQAITAFKQFAAFQEDALARIAPDEIRKKGRVQKNASVFFTIFQTFMSGPVNEAGERTPYFGAYPPDFFDFIIIDECHRGGARDESSWRGILEYFSPAVQLGLTATPKRKDNVDTYAYFGEPVYRYSLKEGINDGFLTPFRVKQFATTLDDYVYTDDDEVLEGEIEIGHRYTESEFQRNIQIDEREAYRVKLFMESIDPTEKTLVFCATQEHAGLVRDLINQLKTNKDPDYCHRVTANDGTRGDQHLREFQSNDKTIPTILTTSRKLSTGVDARNVRNIVLMRPVKSMIEFKQIIGRGTRNFDGKDYFTIYDFVKAYQNFEDPEWDGDAIQQELADDAAFQRIERPKFTIRQDDGEPLTPKNKPVKIKLADGKERHLQHMVCTTFWHADGTPISAQQFMEKLFGQLPHFFKDEAELRSIWKLPQTRRKLLDGLAQKGFGTEQLIEMQKIIDAQNSDLFDVLAYIAYAMPTLTRQARAQIAQKSIQQHYSTNQQIFLEFVLANYVRVGVEELDQDKLSSLLKLKYQNSIHDAIFQLGDTTQIKHFFSDFQQYLYNEL